MKNNKTVYRGFWWFGQTGWQGRSFIPGWMKGDSKTYFDMCNHPRLQKLFPSYAYSSFGLVRHHPPLHPYSKSAIATILKYFTIKVAVYDSNAMSVVKDDVIANYSELKQYDWVNHLKDNDRYAVISAYSGDNYVGDMAHAYKLINMGIYKPHSPSSSTYVCSYGYSFLDGKWYGWSHRAMYGFEIGSVVTKGHCAYLPKNKEDFMVAELEWHGHDEYHALTESIEDSEVQHGVSYMGVRTSWVYNDVVPNVELRGTVGSTFSPYPEFWGNGEWTAKTDDDARKMAIDFARGVS